jgi:hypothetical protein
MKLGRKSASKLPYQEGDWFLIPLVENRSAIGLAARVARTGIIVMYCFQLTARNEPPSPTYIRTLTRQDAALIAQVSDLGIVQGHWPLIYHPETWMRSQWPLPKFGKIIGGTALAYVVELSESTLQVAREVPTTIADASRLPRLYLYGYQALEIELAQRLTGK